MVEPTDEKPGGNGHGRSCCDEHWGGGKIQGRREHSHESGDNSTAVGTRRASLNTALANSIRFCTFGVVTVVSNQVVIICFHRDMRETPNILIPKWPLSVGGKK